MIKINNIVKYRTVFPRDPWNPVAPQYFIVGPTHSLLRGWGRQPAVELGLGAAARNGGPRLKAML